MSLSHPEMEINSNKGLVTPPYSCCPQIVEWNMVLFEEAGETIMLKLFTLKRTLETSLILGVFICFTLMDEGFEWVEESHAQATSTAKSKPTQENENHQTKQSKVWGKIVKSKRQIEGFSYFVTYYQGDQLLAYPIRLRPDQEKDFEINIGKLSTIVGEVKTRSITYDGGQKLALYFVLSKIEPLKLYDLSSLPKEAPKQEVLNEDDELSQKLSQSIKVTNNKVPARGGIEISDKAANTAIAIGGAALLGSILADILN